MESDHDLISLFEHDLLGKPVSTLLENAPVQNGREFPAISFLRNRRRMTLQQRAALRRARNNALQP
jgi:hypothetical protein